MDLRLLLKAQHGGSLWGVQLQPDDVMHLGHAQWVPRPFERCVPTRLERERPARCTRQWPRSCHSWHPSSVCSSASLRATATPALRPPRVRYRRPMWLGAPGRGPSSSPSKPLPGKCLRHSPTAARVVPSSADTVVSLRPAATSTWAWSFGPTRRNGCASGCAGSTRGARGSLCATRTSTHGSRWGSRG